MIVLAARKYKKKFILGQIYETYNNLIIFHSGDGSAAFLQNLKIKISSKFD